MDDRYSRYIPDWGGWLLRTRELHTAGLGDGQ